MRTASFQCVACVAVAIGGLAASARAEKVLLDFGNNTSFRGLSVTPNPDANGNTWNSVVPGNYYGPSTTPLVTTTGGATTVAEGFTTSVGTDSYNGPAGATAGAAGSAKLQGYANGIVLSPSLGDLQNNNAAFDFASGSGNDDGVGANAAATQFVISGLNTSETYSLTFYGGHIYDSQSTTYGVYADAAYAVPLGSATLDTQFVDPITGGEDANVSNVVTIGGLIAVPDGVGSTTGNLYVEFSGNGGSLSGNGYLNSLEIVGGTVPEPTSLAVCAVGGLALARRRRA